MNIIISSPNTDIEILPTTPSEAVNALAELLTSGNQGMHYADALDIAELFVDHAATFRREALGAYVRFHENYDDVELFITMHVEDYK